MLLDVQLTPGFPPVLCECRGVITGLYHLVRQHPGLIRFSGNIATLKNF